MTKSTSGYYNLQVRLDELDKPLIESAVKELGFRTPNDFVYWIVTNVKRGKIVKLEDPKAWGLGLDPDVLKSQEEYSRGEYEEVNDVDEYIDSITDEIKKEKSRDKKS